MSRSRVVGEAIVRGGRAERCASPAVGRLRLNYASELAVREQAIEQLPFARSIRRIRRVAFEHLFKRQVGPCSTARAGHVFGVEGEDVEELGLVRRTGPTASRDTSVPLTALFQSQR